MGIFKDLGFLNQDGVLTSPDCQAINGLTAQNILDNAYNAVTFTPDSDGQISILASGFTSTSSKLTTNDIFGDASCLGTYGFNSNYTSLTGGTVALTAVGTPTYSTTTRFGTESLDIAVGVDNYVKTGAIPTASAVSFWIYVPTAIAAGATAGSIGRLTNSHSWDWIALGDNSTNMANETFSVYCNSYGAYSYITSNISIGWHHFVLSWNSSAMNWDIYMDSIKQTTLISGSYSAKPTIDLWMGKREIAASPVYAHKWDQVRIFNRALTQSDVNNLYTESVTTIVPKTITQAATQNDWRKYQVKAVNLNGSISVNGSAQTFLSTTKNVPDFFGDNSNVATYLLDGNANDARGTYNGTASNVTYSTGKFGQCAVGNGTSTEININGLSITSSRTVSFWVKSNYTIANNCAVFSSRDTGDDYLEGIVIRAGNGALSDFIINIGVNTFSINPLDLNWNNIIIVDNTINYMVYFNGVLKITQPVQTGHKKLSSFNLFRRSGSPAPQFFNGSIDNVRIFNRALTASEVTKLYEEDTTTFTAVEDRTRTLTTALTGTVDKVTIDTWVK